MTSGRPEPSRAAERLDCSQLGARRGRVLREVVVERQMDDALGRRGAQHVEVLDRAAAHLGACGAQGGR